MTAEFATTPQQILHFMHTMLSSRPGRHSLPPGADEQIIRR